MPDPAETRRECPPPHVWDEIATGLMMGDRAEQALDHAARCTFCAAALRESLAVFAPGMPARQPLWRSRWAAAALFVLSIGGAAWSWLRQPTPEHARLQLAEAYSGSRLLEVRWPGARYARYALTRGSAVSVPGPSGAFEAIRLESARQPNEPGWQLASAQLSILSGNPEGALTQLEGLRGSGRIPIAETLAIAFYQQAELTGQRAGYEASSRIWAEVLATDPANRAALHNAALAAERLDQLVSAIGFLEKLIALEQDPGWRQEAVERRDHLRLQIERRSKTK